MGPEGKGFLGRLATQECRLAPRLAGLPRAIRRRGKNEVEVAWRTGVIFPCEEVWTYSRVKMIIITARTEFARGENYRGWKWMGRTGCGRFYFRLIWTHLSRFIICFHYFLLISPFLLFLFPEMYKRVATFTVVSQVSIREVTSSL